MVPVPIDTPPSRNVIVPVGEPAPGETALTIAVNATGWPNVDETGDDVTVIDVVALVTV